MIYYTVESIILIGLCLFAYILFFHKKYVFGFLVASVICCGFLSFYIFYYIASYMSTPEDISLKSNITRIGDGKYLLKIDMEWIKRPYIFGFNGGNDLLVIRYNPKNVHIVSADKTYNETELGKNVVKLSKEFKYSKIDSNEKEIYFDVADGHNFSTKIIMEGQSQESLVNIFFLHDVDKPFEYNVFWEKQQAVLLNYAE